MGDTIWRAAAPRDSVRGTTRFGGRWRRGSSRMCPGRGIRCQPGLGTTGPNAPTPANPRLAIIAQSRAAHHLHPRVSHQRWPQSRAHLAPARGELPSPDPSPVILMAVPWSQPRGGKGSDYCSISCSSLLLNLVQLITCTPGLAISGGRRAEPTCHRLEGSSPHQSHHP